MRLFTLAFVATCLGGIAAHAAGPNPAHVSAVSGKVLLNSGKGFHTAKTNNPLRIGEMIFVSEGASVTITYEAANCSVTYSAPQNLILPETAPCQTGQNLAMAENSVIEPANFSMIPGTSFAFPQIAGLMVFGAPFTFGVITTFVGPASAP